MDYNEKDDKATIASEAAASYKSNYAKTTITEVESECLTLEESKKQLLERVHQHYHSQS